MLTMLEWKFFKKNHWHDVLFLFLFIFQLQFIFNVFVYWVQMHSIVVRRSCILQSGPLNTSSAHLAPDKVVYDITDSGPCAAIYVSVAIL